MRNVGGRVSAWLLAALLAVSVSAQPALVKYSITRLDGDLLSGIKMNDGTAFVVGTGSIVMGTRDAGESWQQIPIDPTIHFTAGVKLSDTSILLIDVRGRTFLLDSPFVQIRPLGGGIAFPWQIASSIASNEDVILILDTLGAVYRYGLRDSSLSVVSALEGGAVRCLISADSAGIFAGSRRGIFKSLDGGSTWRNVFGINAAATAWVSGYRWKGDTLGFLLSDTNGYEQTLVATVDAGRTWRTSKPIRCTGRLLRFDGRSCLIAQIEEPMVGVARIDNVFGDSLVVEQSTMEQRRKFVNRKLTGLMDFGAKNSILFGRYKTIYRSTDSSRTFEMISHLSRGLDYQGYINTSALDRNTLSLAGLNRRHFISTDGGVLWRTNTNSYSSSGTLYVDQHRIVSKECVITSYTNRRIDISTDGGDYFRYEGLRGMDDRTASCIIGADEIYKAVVMDVAVISDSGRTWDVKKVPVEPLIDKPDSIFSESQLDDIRAAGPYVYLRFHTLVMDLVARGHPDYIQYLVRTDREFTRFDTLLVIDSSRLQTRITISPSGAIRCISARSVPPELRYILSTDHGVTWDTAYGADVPNKFKYEVPSSYTVRSDSGRVYLTLDSGLTWQSIALPPSFADPVTRHLENYDRTRVFVRTRDGLFRFDLAPDSGVVQSVDAEPAPPPSPVHVRAVIPNPFSASVRFIIGTEPSVDTRSLSVGVYSLNGALVADLTESYRSQTPDDRGEVTLQWDATEQSQGVYRVIVQSAQGSQSVSVVKAR